MILIGCRGLNDPLPLRSPELYGPFVTGIIITDETGPDPIDHWRKPSLPEDSHNNLILSNPFPNPGNVNQKISFVVDTTLKLSIWIVEASQTVSDSGHTLTMLNGEFATPHGLAIRTLARNHEFGPGAYLAVWNGLNDDRILVPDGFYRIYFQAGALLLWRDMLWLRNPCNSPIDLQKLFSTANGC